ncbi:terminase, partial [Lacticaseibacillus saniviri]|nr:terminase [Lacticaseibacillus saniviri]
QELTLAAIEAVPTYERIPFMEVENELAPDTSAQIFWLKNRKPEVYRDQSFKALNEAQASKAIEDARKAHADADMAEFKAKLLNDPDAQDRTVIVDDVPDTD